MRFRFVVDGPKYSKHKAAFKRMLRDHRLSWRGTMGEFEWSSGRERVRAEYERDAVRDVTVRATLVWEGKAKTAFLNELKAWVFSLGGDTAEQTVRKGVPRDASERVEKDLEIWDRLHKPDVEALRAQGRPEDWIERDLRAWRTEREAKRKDLVGT